MIERMLYNILPHLDRMGAVEVHRYQELIAEEVAEAAAQASISGTGKGPTEPPSLELVDVLEWKYYTQGCLQRRVGQSPDDHSFCDITW